MAQPEGGLAGIVADAEEVELEDGVHLAEFGGDPGLHPEAGLPDAEVGLAACAELVLERGQLGGSHDVEPVGVETFASVADVGHRESVELEARLVVSSVSRLLVGLDLLVGLLLGLRPQGVRPGEQNEDDELHGRRQSDELYESSLSIVLHTRPSSSLIRLRFLLPGPDLGPSLVEETLEVAFA